MKEGSIFDNLLPVFVEGRTGNSPAKIHSILRRKADPKIKTWDVINITAYANPYIIPQNPCILTVTKGEE